LAFLAVLACAFALPDLMGERVFRLHEGKLLEKDEATVASILSELDVWGHAADGGLELKAPPNAGRDLSALGLNITDVTDFHMAHFKWFEQNDQVCMDESCQKTWDDFYTRYQSLDNIEARMISIQEQHTNLARHEVFGNSNAGRAQRGLRLAGPNGGQQFAIFYFCGIHAREWLTPMFCTYAAEHLTGRYSTDARVRAILDQYAFYIIPVMNVDGYTFSMTGGNNMWRKSRKTNSGSTCIGTDLNRNWADGFGGGGSSGNPCTETFRGQTAYDNVETANMKRFVDGLNIEVSIFMDIHAYGQMWMHPWGKNNQLPPDNGVMQQCGDASAIAIRQVNGLTFRTGTVNRVIYQASGVSVDSMYANKGIVFSYTPEVRGSSFQPPASNIMPSNLELWAGMIAQIECVSFFKANPKATVYPGSAPFERANY